MTDPGLHRLSRAAGLEVDWTDAAGQQRRVSPGVQRAVLTALSLPCQSQAQITESLAQLKAQKGEARKVPARAKGFFPEGENLWGVAVQLYALQGGTTKGFGDFAALGDFARQAAARGAAAVAISPVHALFGAAPDHFSPYAPSTRLFLNPLYAPLGHAAGTGKQGLVDWRHASAAKWAALRKSFAAFREKEDQSSFRIFVKKGGQRLLDHARFEVLDARFRGQGLAGWRNWPAAYQDSHSAAVRGLTPDSEEVAFQLYAQWRADEGLARAQRDARDCGMAIGLITDMAVGVDPGGSHAWSAPDEVLQRLTIGAPPDQFNSKGQNWGLTNISPLALRRTGFEGFIATVRSAMRHAGGIRLDHAMGLERIWVIPEGAPAVDGVYLHYPRDELLALLAMESRRHRALVVAEDLGTVPKGFRAKIAAARFLGMRVLWFERDGKGGFLPPRQWDRRGAALSTTHDLPTLAGWWSGRDIAWRGRLGASVATLAKARKERAKDRVRLWSTLRAAGGSEGAAPAPARPERFIDAAFKDLAATRCPLKLLPVEDFLGEGEQPNIPGTIDEHPNWRRRLKTARPFDGAAACRRAAILGKPER